MHFFNSVKHIHQFDFSLSVTAASLQNVHVFKHIMTRGFSKLAQSHTWATFFICFKLVLKIHLAGNTSLSEICKHLLVYELIFTTVMVAVCLVFILSNSRFYEFWKPLFQMSLTVFPASYCLCPADLSQTMFTNHFVLLHSCARSPKWMIFIGSGTFKLSRVSCHSQRWCWNSFCVNSLLCFVPWLAHS